MNARDTGASISPNTQAILLLTAPLRVGRRDVEVDILSFGEYKKLARLLREEGYQPADLLGPAAPDLLKKWRTVFDTTRLERLIARGLVLSQAIESWRARAIWVVSRADHYYPRKLKTRLKEDAPAVLYGCGDPSILDAGGLAVVGSRHVDESLIEYTERIGRLVALANRTVVSGAARGIDQAAMRGALDAGGHAAGVLADSLERAVLSHEYRDGLINGRLVLMSPYDPAVGFNVGHAMQRNKVVYALADAALVVNSDFQNGGTWTGAVEQLERMRLVPIYVRSTGPSTKGLEALLRMGALPWPNPGTPDALLRALVVKSPATSQQVAQEQLSFERSVTSEPTAPETDAIEMSDDVVVISPAASSDSPAEELFAKVRELLERITDPKTESEIARELCVSKPQAKQWLQRLIKEGRVERLSKPLRYRVTPYR